MAATAFNALMNFSTAACKYAFYNFLCAFLRQRLQRKLCWWGVSAISTNENAEICIFIYHKQHTRTRTSTYENHTLKPASTANVTHTPRVAWSASTLTYFAILRCSVAAVLPVLVLTSFT